MGLSKQGGTAGDTLVPDINYIRERGFYYFKEEIVNVDKGTQRHPGYSAGGIRLRKKGFSADMDYLGRSLKAQMKFDRQNQCALCSDHR